MGNIQLKDYFIFTAASLTLTKLFSSVCVAPKLAMFCRMVFANIFTSSLFAIYVARFNLMPFLCLLVVSCFQSLENSADMLLSSHNRL